MSFNHLKVVIVIVANKQVCSANSISSHRCTCYTDYSSISPKQNSATLKLSVLETGVFSLKRNNVFVLGENGMRYVRYIRTNVNLLLNY